jgi:hypothetical protein
MVTIYQQRLILVLTLSRDGREYIVDGVQSYRDFNNGETTISIDVKVDREVFCDCKYDLKETDFLLVI